MVMVKISSDSNGTIDLKLKYSLLSTKNVDGNIKFNN